MQDPLNLLINQPDETYMQTPGEDRLQQIQSEGRQWFQTNMSKFLNMNKQERQKICLDFGQRFEYYEQMQKDVENQDSLNLQCNETLVTTEDESKAVQLQSNSKFDEDLYIQTMQQEETYTTGDLESQRKYIEAYWDNKGDSYVELKTYANKLQSIIMAKLRNQTETDDRKKILIFWTVNKLNNYQDVEHRDLISQWQWYDDFINTLPHRLHSSLKYFRKTFLNTINNELSRIAKHSKNNRIQR